ncbi:hypothetical protein E4K65_04430 [Bradyrhizobium niftali]|uniref:Uncharacterized protein n=1 Tax=Bradyrhizobium niftali TaxID=2560055 RepID=A0A4Y9M911_9BRAD|nr:hypothetical protein E4K65_04430 [Bradyrhizobium niftali]
MTLALILAKHGVPVTVLEAEQGVTFVPDDGELDRHERSPGDDAIGATVAGEKGSPPQADPGRDGG